MGRRQRILLDPVEHLPVGCVNGGMNTNKPSRTAARRAAYQALRAQYDALLAPVTSKLDADLDAAFKAAPDRAAYEKAAEALRDAFSFRDQTDEEYALWLRMERAYDTLRRSQRSSANARARRHA